MFALQLGGGFLLVYASCQDGVLLASPGFYRAGIPAKDKLDRAGPPQFASTYHPGPFVVYFPVPEAAQVPHLLWVVRWKPILCAAFSSAPFACGVKWIL